MVKTLFTLLFITLLPLLAQEEASKKVVYDLTTNSLKSLERKLISGIVAHKTYYQNHLQTLDVQVIVHGESYKFFLKDLSTTPYKKDQELLKAQKDLAKRLKSLAQNYDVKFLVCEVGILQRGWRKKEFYPFVSFVHSAPIGLIDAQNSGYAYLPLH